MRPIIQETSTITTPESLAEQLQGEAGLILLRSALFDSQQARYSFVTARPFLTFRSFGSRCELQSRHNRQIQFGNPWRLLESLMARYELLDEVDLPFPLGGCFGYWGYGLKNFVEPKLRCCTVDDLELPDCHVGFYDSLVAFDHLLQKTWVVSTGLEADGLRYHRRAREKEEFWEECLAGRARSPLRAANWRSSQQTLYSDLTVACRGLHALPSELHRASAVSSNLTRGDFVDRVQRALSFIRSGDIYQVNLAQRLAAPYAGSGWELFADLSRVSPAPFSAFLDCGDFRVASSSPELFLRLSGSQIHTRPIKGTRPRSDDPTRDAQLSYELQTSAKEMAELVMITDLLRNDLGKVCEFGSVQVPELVRLERYPQVQHLVSTVEGRLRPDTTHFGALAASFPGGSVTGAPKFRAMEMIDELEPNARGPYTGALGYVGFNRESQLSIIIRAAICQQGTAYFHAGAGIVADSSPAAEYEETLAKARGFLQALRPVSAGLLPLPIGWGEGRERNVIADGVKGKE
jgi:para-aminobenzoate synthetase component 1